VAQIQFNSVYFEQPIITNYKFASEGLYTDDIPVPGPHIGSGKTPKKKKKPFHGEKWKKPSGEQQRRIPLPGWTEAIDVMCTEGIITELQHIQLI